ncbi:MAG: carbamoyltransferase HypF [Maricaulaceae bacterium]
MDGSTPAASLRRAHVRVRGAVQGVGFRPFVWSLAQELGLAGSVLNDEDGVWVEAEGWALDAFLSRLTTDAPPLARVDRVEVTETAPVGARQFTIARSAKASSAKTLITPDAATCPACLAEMFDPADRRYRYPFANCTHCGPRYTITASLPYDRAQTSMAGFPMCQACRGEYEDPADRRFHAQPNACADCGPRYSHAPEAVLAALREGLIVALKGIGGFHLCVDARNGAAVERLRARKRRDAKPFAVMVPGLPAARTLATVSKLEADALTHRGRPVVVCRAQPGTGLAAAVSDGLPTLGLMLPYAPFHFLIFHEAAGRPQGLDWLERSHDLALVMTSANPGGEPLVIDNAEARDRLADIADVIVDHDRDILVRCDDSVVRVIDGAPAFLRRARGFTPEPIRLGFAPPPILAVGGHLKTTVCVTRGDEAFLSQHIGSMDNLETYRFFEETVDHLTDLLEVTPEIVACDQHPDFLTTRFAEQFGAPVERVQHHHAHIAAVMAEHGLDGPVLGLALDGFGLGEDGESWGGERLVVDAAGFRRTGGLRPLAQPGGDKAAQEPWRMAAAALHALGRGADIAARFPDQPGAELIAAMLARGVNAPMTSSAGRLFDTAAGLLGVRSVSRFEGEAAMALEGLARSAEVLADGWRLTDDGTLDLRPLLAILVDCDPQTGARLFHGTLAQALVAWAIDGLACDGLARCVALSGGCWQNKLLFETVRAGLTARGVEVFAPAQAPANDGGLSLGQAWVAGNRALKRLGRAVPCV